MSSLGHKLKTWLDGEVICVHSKSFCWLIFDQQNDFACKWVWCSDCWLGFSSILASDCLQATAYALLYFLLHLWLLLLISTVSVCTSHMSDYYWHLSFCNCCCCCLNVKQLTEWPQELQWMALLAEDSSSSCLFTILEWNVLSINVTDINLCQY